jgi:hypothetical protein
MRDVCHTLESRGVTGYSVVHAVTGSGDRGFEAGDELSDAFSNSYLITAFPPEQLMEIVEAVRPILRRSGRRVPRLRCAVGDPLINAAAATRHAR